MLIQILTLALAVAGTELVLNLKDLSLTHPNKKLHIRLFVCLSAVTSKNKQTNKQRL